MTHATLFSNAKKHLLTALLPSLALCAMLAAAPARAVEGVIATIPTDTNPWASVVNPITNMIYVTSDGSNNISVIDGATNTISKVPVGSPSYRIALNTVTNKIYVPNPRNNTVTVIDGATNSTTTVATGSYPYAIAVNPITNKIYVANLSDGSVTVIDGATNSTSMVAVGGSPVDIAVNPTTNQIYVANPGTATITVIDGVTNSTTTLAVGTDSSAFLSFIAVNPVTNKIYVANHWGITITVIDGATNTFSTIPVAAPGAGNYYMKFAINSVTNKVYMTSANTLSVLDGATNAMSTIIAGVSIADIAVNPTTNKVYGIGNGFMEIDGVTHSITTVPADIGTAYPDGFAVNPITNRIYAPSTYTNTVVVIGDTPDTTPPALTMPVLASSYKVGSSVMLAFAATDTQSQLASVTATLNGVPVSSGGTVVLNQLGANTFTLTATDTAGNTATQSLEFTVIEKTGGLHSQSTCNNGIGNGDEGCVPGKAHLNNPFK